MSDLEWRHGSVESVEPEHELVEIVRQVPRLDAMVGIYEPGFQIGEDAVDVGETIGRDQGSHGGADRARTPSVPLSSTRATSLLNV